MEVVQGEHGVTGVVRQAIMTMTYDAEGQGQCCCVSGGRRLPLHNCCAQAFHRIQRRLFGSCCCLSQLLHAVGWLPGLVRLRQAAIETLKHCFFIEMDLSLPTSPPAYFQGTGPHRAEVSTVEVALKSNSMPCIQLKSAAACRLCVLLPLQPTFTMYKGPRKVENFTGARIDLLRKVLQQHAS